MTNSTDSVASSLVLGIVKAAQRLSLPTDHLLKQADISIAQLEDSSARIHFDQFHLFIQLLEQQNDKNIGMQLGSELGIASFNALGYAAAHCNTLADALLLIPKYESLVMTIGKTEIRTQKNHVHVLWSMKDMHQNPLLEDLFLASWLTFSRLFCGKQLINDKYEVEFNFTHSEPHNLLPWTTLFGPLITFNQAHAKVTFCQSLLALKLLHTDPFVHKLMLKEADNMNSAFCTDLADKINGWIASELANGEPEFKKLATHLSMSERTLRRRLEDEGLGFKTLLNTFRKEKAHYLLQNTDLSLWEISEKLGYKQLTTFNAAYKRWTGNTPASQRKH